MVEERKGFHRAWLVFIGVCMMMAGGMGLVLNVMGNFFANDYPICAPGLSHGRCLTLGALLGNAVATEAKL